MLLITHLYSAIQRGVINIQQYPLEYMYLRDEVFSYLRKLSSQGLIRATEILSLEYRVNRLQPEDHILNYYYVYLALKQKNPARGNQRLRNYDTLSEKQKIIVDRMTQNL